MAHDAKQTMFDHYRKNLTATGISTASADSLICPLCWQETPYDDLTIEHVVPGSVGGKQTTLTCRRCNNDHGSDLDAHLAQYQRITDAFQGRDQLKTKLNINGHELVANLEWGDGHKHFHIVGKATNPAASDGLQQDFAASNVSTMNCTLFFDYIKNNFQTDVLRAAYLIIFKCFDYRYVHHEVVQAIRRRIADPSLEHPRLASLILEARNFKPPYDAQHHVVPGNVNGVEFFLVIIRVRRATTTYLGAYLPVPVDRSDEFFGLMELCAKEHNGEMLTIPTEAMFS
ncbi:HNH endonuclease [Planctomycetota bacterium]